MTEPRTDPMDEAKISAALDDCLLETDSFTPELWRDLSDSFSNWN